VLNFYQYAVKACKKTSLRDNAPEERHQADREGAAVADRFRRQK